MNEIDQNFRCQDSGIRFKIPVYMAKYDLYLKIFVSPKQCNYLDLTLQSFTKNSDYHDVCFQKICQYNYVSMQIIMNLQRPEITVSLSNFFP